MPLRSFITSASLVVALEFGKDQRQEEKWSTEDKMVEWHHRLNGHEFEQTLGDGEGQRSLACCSPWGHKELDTAEQLKRADRIVKTWKPHKCPSGMDLLNRL